MSCCTAGLLSSQGAAHLLQPDLPPVRRGTVLLWGPRVAGQTVPHAHRIPAVCGCPGGAAAGESERLGWRNPGIGECQAGALTAVHRLLLLLLQCCSWTCCCWTLQQAACVGGRVPAWLRGRWGLQQPGQQMLPSAQWAMGRQQPSACASHM
jgi:hypothetical protein